MWPHFTDTVTLTGFLAVTKEIIIWINTDNRKNLFLTGGVLIETPDKVLKMHCGESH